MRDVVGMQRLPNVFGRLLIGLLNSPILRLRKRKYSIWNCNLYWTNTDVIIDCCRRRKTCFFLVVTVCRVSGAFLLKPVTLSLTDWMLLAPSRFS